MDGDSGDGQRNSVKETCHICGQECLNEAEMNIHMAIHRDQLVCLYCDFVAIDCNEMTDHLYQVHQVTPKDVSDKTDVEKMQDKITCLFCDFVTASSDEMNIHINIIHLSDSPCNAEDKPVVRTNKDNRSIQVKDKIPATSYTQTVLGVNSGFLEVEKDNKKPKLDDSIKFESSDALSCRKLSSAESSINGSHFGIHSEGNKPNLRSDAVRIYSRVDTNSKPAVSSSKCSSDLDDTPCHSNGDSVLNKTTTGLDARLSLQAECYLCPFCEFVTDNEQAYERHLREEQSVAEAPMVCEDARPLEEPGSSTSLQCPFCGMNFKEHGPLELHVHHEHLKEESSGGTMDEGAEGLLSEQSASEAPVLDEDMHPEEESRSSESFQCPICGLSFMDLEPCQSHVERHGEKSSGERKPRGSCRSDHPLHSDSFADDAPQAKRSSVHKTSVANGAPEKPSGSSFPSGWTESGDSQHSWPPSALRDDMGSATFGVYEQLIRHYEYKRSISNVWLCSNVVHYASKLDRGWGCGFRNFQMMLSCLVTSPVFASRLLDGLPGSEAMPSVLRIQQMLETAWNMGYDVQGSKHFDGQIVDSKKWIGATDIAALLSSRGIKCTLVDFHAPSAPNGTHPLLFEWAKNYFAKPAPFKPPIYFQYNGHSKTIIGVEEHRDESLRLLILDPSVPPYKMRSAAHAAASENLIRLIRYPPSSLKNKQYQLLSVDGIMNDNEIEESKIIKSIRLV